MESVDPSMVARGRFAVLSAHLSASVESEAFVPVIEASCVSSQSVIAPPPNLKGSLTIIDERTGKKHQFQVAEEGTVKATDFKKITTGKNDKGLKLYDPGYLNTAPVQSSICYIDGDEGILRYRGYPIEELAEGSSFLEVAYLLLYGNLPTENQLADWEFAVSQHSAVPQGILDIIQAMPHDAHPMGVLVSAMSALSVFHPDANPALRGQDLYKSKQVRDKQIVRIIGKAPTIAAAAYLRMAGRPPVLPSSNLSYSENFLYMLDSLGNRSYKPNPRLARVLDILFILHAEHEMNCSTAAARHLASSGVDVYTALAGAVGALYGPLHGGANEAVLKMLGEIGTVDNIPEFIEGVKNRKRKMSGFGHRVYKNYDPRAKVIRKLAEEVFSIVGRDPLIEVAVALEKAALSDEYFVKRKLYPNVDFYSGLIYRAMGFPTEFFPVLFAIPRMAGYLSHWRESLDDPDTKIMRPAQVYTGVWLRHYMSLKERMVTTEADKPGQAREKFLSLRKGTKNDIATILEEELHNARSAFEQDCFNLVTALSNVEAKKWFEFLEAVSDTMDAHLRYFKQGCELLNQMEPYINQVLTYAQQSRERSNYEQAALNERMQEYKRQIDRESRRSSNGSNGSPNGDGIQAIGRSSHKMIEAVMQSAAKGKVQTIRQGYLSKRSSNLRGDWKRRFFVLDSKGMLYYYRKQCSKPSGSGSQLSGQRNSSELGSGLLSRWLSSHYHGGVHDEKSVAHHTVNLLTSTIKVDADQSDLRFCFRIISPTKNYTLQAESALDQMDWIEKITGVIASLLSSQAPERCLPTSPMGSSHHRSASESSSFESSDFDHTAAEEYASERLACGHHERTLRSSQQHRPCVKGEKPIDVLRKVCGNDRCADCGAPEPDWASLNLGVLVCIECSGVHRNLGVHISKVRSLTLDVKVWEPSVISLFQSLGNTFANSVWEELLQSRSGFQVDLVPTSLYKSGKPQVYFISKPNHADSISVKEKFIHAKYEDKLLVRRPRDNHTVAQQIWEAVRINDKKAVYRHIVNSEADVNSVHEQVYCKSLTLAKVMLLQDQTSIDHNSSFLTGESPAKTLNSSNLAGTSEGHAMEDLEGCSLLHLACETADIGMLELLLQYGANINASDLRGQTPLHRCILGGKATFVKLLLSRGADPRAVNGEGKNPFELAVESNFEDSEVLAVLSYSNR